MRFDSDFTETSGPQIIQSSPYSKCVLSISRRHSYHLLRNALAAKFPCGQSEFLRPGSLPSSGVPCLPRLCNGSIYLLPPFFAIPLKWKGTESSKKIFGLKFVHIKMGPEGLPVDALCQKYFDRLWSAQGFIDTELFLRLANRAGGVDSRGVR